MIENLLPGANPHMTGSGYGSVPLAWVSSGMEPYS